MYCCHGNVTARSCKRPLIMYMSSARRPLRLFQRWFWQFFTLANRINSDNGIPVALFYYLIYITILLESSWSYIYITFVTMETSRVWLCQPVNKEYTDIPILWCLFENETAGKPSERKWKTLKMDKNELYTMYVCIVAMETSRKSHANVR